MSTDPATIADLIRMLEKHDAEMTAAPWEARPFDESQTTIIGDKSNPLVCTVSVGHRRPSGNANAVGIPALRNAIPELLRHLRDTERMRKALEATLKSAVSVSATSVVVFKKDLEAICNQKL